MAECFPVVDKEHAWAPNERTRRGETLVEHPETLVQGCALGLASIMSQKGKLDVRIAARTTNDLD